MNRRSFLLGSAAVTALALGASRYSIPEPEDHILYNVYIEPTYFWWGSDGQLVLSSDPKAYERS